MPKLLILLGVLGLLLAACGRGQAVQIDDDDPEMNAAMAEARATLPQFVAALESKAEGNQYLLKARFAEGKDAEHLWLSDITHQDGIFAGKLSNAPMVLAKLQAGDAVQVSSQDVSDWMILGNGKYRGGYTQRVMRERLSAAEQAEFDQAMGSPE